MIHEIITQYFFCPHLTYCYPVWCTLPKTHFEIFHKRENKFARINYNGDLLENFAPILRFLNTLNYLVTNEYLAIISIGQSIQIDGSPCAALFTLYNEVYHTKLCPNTPENILTSLILVFLKFNLNHK